MPAESAGCETQHTSAARAKCFSRASATKYSICRMNMLGDYFPQCIGGMITRRASRRADQYGFPIVQVGEYALEVLDLRYVIVSNVGLGGIMHQIVLMIALAA